MNPLVTSATSVYSLFVDAPIGCGVCVGSLFCGLVPGALSSLGIILLRKRELIALL